MPATCGADYHEAGGWGEGAPFIYVYAASLSTADILDGVRGGRVMRSSGARLNLGVSAGDGLESAGVGDRLYCRAQRVRLEVAWEDAPAGARLQVRGKQGVMVNEVIAEAGSLQPWLDISEAERLWVEVYTGEGALSALTNPVYINENV
jgi:hypothetical protein